MFMSKPYCLPQKVATVLAHLCCFQRSLPQGAPTSPVISNMICAPVDRQLQQLAKMNHSTYTRYADDLTFSTTRKSFPTDLASENDLNQVCVGKELKRVIEDNGFSVNNRKVWLRGRHRRQVVTNLTVNEFPNLPRKFSNQIRAMLHAWNKHGIYAAQDEWRRKELSLNRAPWRRTPSFRENVKGKIEYLGMIKGQDSPLYLKFLDELRELDPEASWQTRNAFRTAAPQFSRT